MNTQKWILGIILIAIAVGAGLLVYFQDEGSADGAFQSEEMQVLQGTVTYRERIALPSGSVLEVDLEDSSRADAQAKVIASYRAVTAGENVPLPFALEYDANDIDERLSYILRARIYVDGELQWVNTSSTPGITRGVPVSDPEIVLSRVSRDTLDMNPSTTAETNLEGRWVWLRTERMTGSPVQAPPGEKFVLSFDGEGNASSSTDCNGLGGTYIVNGEVLSFGPFISTLMFCEGSLEGVYSQDLSLTNSYTIQGDILRLNLNRDVGVMIFEKQ